MLAPKELLQINATILAGLFILLTLISVDDKDRLEIEVENIHAELEIFSEERKILDKQKEELDAIVDENNKRVILYTQKLNESKKIFENLNSSINPELIKHDLPYYEDLREFIGIEYSRIIEKQEVYTPLVEEYNQKITASNKQKDELLKKIEDAETKAETIEKEYNFFKNPKMWIYWMGAFFGMSAIFSLSASYFQNKHLKNYDGFIKLAYTTMYLGLGFVIFLSFGILSS